MSSEKHITGFATGELGSRLAGLSTEDGSVALGPGAEGWVTGDVTIGERKGKSFAIYSLEVELPWSGPSGSGTVVLPDVSPETLGDLEVQVLGDALPDAARAALVASVQRVLTGWSSALGKAVRDGVDDAMLDPPSSARQPRAAALISDEESMSASVRAARKSLPRRRAILLAILRNSLTPPLSLSRARRRSTRRRRSRRSLARTRARRSRRSPRRRWRRCSTTRAPCWRRRGWRRRSSSSSSRS